MAWGRMSGTISSGAGEVQDNGHPILRFGSYIRHSGAICFFFININKTSPTAEHGRRTR